MKRQPATGLAATDGPTSTQCSCRPLSDSPWCRLRDWSTRLSSRELSSSSYQTARTPASSYGSPRYPRSTDLAPNPARPEASMVFGLAGLSHFCYLTHMSTEHVQPSITFEPHQVLRRNGLLLEADDFTPSSLRDFVDLHEDVITDQINHIYEQKASRSRQPSLIQRETILIARLALLGHEHKVLRSAAYHNPQRFYDDPSVLSDAYVQFWARMTETTFRPRIRNRSASNPSGSTGLWLGVTLDI